MKRILNLFLVLLMGLVLVGLGTKEVSASEESVLYEIDFESGTNGSYLRSGETTLGVENGLKWTIATASTSDSGIMWNYNSSQDRNITENQGNNIARLHGKNLTSLTSEIIESVSKVTLDAKFYGTRTDSYIKIYAKGKTDNEFVLIKTLGLKTEFNEFTINVNRENVQIKIEGSGERSNIDNIKIYSSPLSLDIDGKVNQMIDDGNTLSTTISAEYGQDINVEVTNTEENKFQFGLVNGVIRDDIVVGGNTLPITDDLEVSLVYAKENNNAVLFLDSNGKLITHTWVMDGEPVTAPNITELSKPGYKISDTPWLSNEGDTSLEGINTSRVYTLQYELVETQVVITVNGTETTYDYNEVVTLESTSEEFKAWVDEDDNVLSTKAVYSFTALTDKTIVESTVAPTTLPIVTMTKDLMLRDNHQTFVGQLELREGDTLVEYGLVVTKDGLLKNEELTLENGTKARTNVLNSLTNEFMLSIPTEYVVIRAYVTVRNLDNEIETLYSANQYNDVAIVTFDTDGGNEIDPVAIKVGTAVQKPADPERPSHEFLGWFVGETEFDFDTLINEDTTIKVRWEEVLPTIAEVRALAVDTATEFKGIVTGIDGNNLFVQDETAAIYLFGANLPEGLKVGDEVRIQGSRAEFNGLQQIGSGATVTIESRDNALPTILEVTDVTTLGASSQTQRITVDGLTVKSQSVNNLILTDGTNDILVYASTGSAVYNHIQTAIVGQEVNIHEAFVGWFKGVQLTVLDVEDLEFVEPSDEELAQLVLDEIVAEWSNKEFNMGTSVELPLTGDFDSTVVWEFDPENAVVEGKWNEVNEDTRYTILVTVTLGEAEVDDMFEIFIKFIDTGEPVSKQVTMEFGSAKYTDSKSSQNGLKTIGELGVTVTSSTAYWDGNANNSLRLGSSKNPGSITLAFNENVKITKVIIYASQYDGAVSIKVNELTTQVVTNATGSEYIGYEFNINNLSSFTVSSVKTSKSRMQIQKIVIEYSPN